jgi:hypothetical protein
MVAKSGWLDQRVELLQQLADSLQAAQAALVRNDLPELRGETSRQERLCLELSQSQAALSLESESTSSDTERHRKDVQDELMRMEREIMRLNRIYGALLRRAGRTVNIFCRVLAASSPTYAVPQCPMIRSVAKKE